MKTIAIIPARSGSKGLPDKNIRPLNGIPLMAHTIKAALESGMFDTVMVSTDSEQYAEIARQYGAEVPFLRSEETSRDDSPTMDAVKEVLKNYEAMGREFDNFCILQPTSPLRDAQDIRDAFAFMKEKNAKYIVSCCELGTPVALTYKLGESRCSTDLTMSAEYYEAIKKHRYLRRQVLPTDYRTNGAIYIRDMEMLRPGYKHNPAESYFFIMPEEKSLDVDSLLDFLICETVLKHKEEFEKLANR